MLTNLSQDTYLSLLKERYGGYSLIEKYLSNYFDKFEASLIHPDCYDPLSDIVANNWHYDFTYKYMCDYECEFFIKERQKLINKIILEVENGKYILLTPFFEHINSYSKSFPFNIYPDNFIQYRSYENFNDCYFLLDSNINSKDIKQIWEEFNYSFFGMTLWLDNHLPVKSSNESDFHYIKKININISDGNAFVELKRKEEKTSDK